MTVRQVILGLGSNQDALANFRRCLDALHARFGALLVSRVFESEPVGMPKSQGNFHNLVVAFESDASPVELKAWSKRQEKAQGRLPKSAGASQHPIDIDLLTVGELCGVIDDIALPRAEITANAFVLQPLAELLPEQRHPASGASYAELWQNAQTNHAFTGQRLWPVDFSWHDEPAPHLSDD
jgi:2-amino-4-hydroxy-6-hydroxymethyldihydropteridine diphosphokinase